MCVEIAWGVDKKDTQGMCWLGCSARNVETSVYTRPKCSIAIIASRRTPFRPRHNCCSAAHVSPQLLLLGIQSVTVWLGYYAFLNCHTLCFTVQIYCDGKQFKALEIRVSDTRYIAEYWKIKPTHTEFTGEETVEISWISPTVHVPVW